ncbi:(3R)-hydroxymyristoyl-(acyl carrier protein) dehydratase [Liberibacter crescens BT-1]|uniref:3-hydroxyacyl-[acyl-carrier-protein] dehydratase FabZ n=1 Tax=Liberibacter crescens (strain BT-1) TaxID=1215343 RepID=L0ESY4_LIBCB|nr:3-hydroxyacyl-ACP dehydratase FabZ [Liberibacter crescens]AGA64042.1 (3R)-hydroxymyristoyl-(acyl carrier protein) dehydratase [Liberibacter crescens BT-1]AMC12346.1 3-hydroxyacyl-ACP dehydratase [Liberibacter crescens]
MSSEREVNLSSLDIIKLMNFLPHRYPFLLVDRIININGDDSAIGIKNVTYNEQYFVGHFPGRPVMPGVLLLEGMAQTAGAICAMKKGNQKNSYVYLTTIDSARFRRPVIPGDCLEYHVFKLKYRMPDIWKFICYAKVNGCGVAEAKIGAVMMYEGKEKE